MKYAELNRLWHLLGQGEEAGYCPSCERDYAKDRLPEWSDEKAEILCQECVEHFWSITQEEGRRML